MILAVHLISQSSFMEDTINEGPNPCRKVSTELFINARSPDRIAENPIETGASAPRRTDHIELYRTWSATWG